MSVITCAPAVARPAAQDAADTITITFTDEQRAAMLDLVAERVATDPDAWPPAVLLMLLRGLAAPYWRRDEQALLDAFEDYWSAWARHDDYQEGNLVLSQVDLGASGPGVDAVVADVLAADLAAERDNLLHGPWAQRAGRAA